MNIALIGYGKMGRMIEKLAIERGHKIVCIIDVDNQDDFESKVFSSADVAIEFTTPNTAYNNIRKCFDKNVKVVTGSTGWQHDHFDEIKMLCEKEDQTLFWSSNYSLGVYLFNKLNEYLAKLMSSHNEYDPHIEEVHHIHKLDAPSGTAITLAENLIKNNKIKKEWVKGKVYGPNGEQSGCDECKAEELLIDSIREGEVAGIHRIIYDSDYDSIEIMHNAKSRGGFVMGAVMAAEYANEHEGLLTMDDLFSIK